MSYHKTSISEPGIPIAALLAKAVTKKPLKDIKLPASMTPPPRYTPPEVSELNNQRAMNAGKTDNPDLRGLPEVFRIGGRHRDSAGDQ